MSSQKLIEYTTQAMAFSIAEVKSVEVKLDSKPETETEHTDSGSGLKGSSLFDRLEE